MARAAESAQAFEAWKQGTRGQLTAADYRWPEDLPFVRIPKAFLPALINNSMPDLYSLSGGVQAFACELLGVTPAEHQSLNGILRQNYLEREAFYAAGIRETNLPLSGRVVAKKAFVLPEPGKEASQRTDQMLAEMRGILGEERWSLVKLSSQRQPGGMVYSIGAGLPGITGTGYSLSVERDDKGTFTVSWLASGSLAGSGHMDLSRFLPSDDPNQTTRSDPFRAGFLSDALCQRVVAWLQEQAMARLGGKEKP